MTALATTATASSRSLCLIASATAVGLDLTVETLSVLAATIISTAKSRPTLPVARAPPGGAALAATQVLFSASFRYLSESLFF